jgi:hypothetical protein
MAFSESAYSPVCGIGTIIGMPVVCMAPSFPRLES